MITFSTKMPTRRFTFSQNRLKSMQELTGLAMCDHIPTLTNRSHPAGKSLFHHIAFSCSIASSSLFYQSPLANHPGHFIAAPSLFHNTFSVHGSITSPGDSEAPDRHGAGTSWRPPSGPQAAGSPRLWAPVRLKRPPTAPQPLARGDES